MNFNVEHLLYILKEQKLHLHADLNHCFMYFFEI